MSLLNDAKRAYELRSQWLGDGGHPVDQATAQARSDTCLACPMHIERKIYEGLAGSAALAVRRQIELKNNLKLRVVGEKSLHVCEACNCILRLKVWVPIKFIVDNTTQEAFYRLDSNCWILKERNEMKTP